jgi:hypothetical protein
MGCGKADWANELRESQLRREGVDPNQYADMYPRASLTGEVSNAPVYVDAHAQMLAARVEGLEKELNGLQHVWGRLKGNESKIEELFALMRRQATFQNKLEAHTYRLQSSVPLPKPINSSDAALELLKLCLHELPPTSDLTGKVAEFLRNR